MIRSIQYLRGVAAVLVLLHHVAYKLHRFSFNPLAWLHCADVGVDIFFIISGFIMCHSVRNHIGAPAEAGNFFRGRIARIIPLYWSLTTLALLVFLVAPTVVNSTGGHTDILASYFLLPVDGKYLVQNGWTLSFEFYFYVLFAIGLFFPAKAGRLLVIVLMSLVACVGFFITPTSIIGAFLLSPLLLEFVFGMTLYVLFERAARIPRFLSLVIGAAGVMIWLLVNFRRGPGVYIEDYRVRVLSYGIPALLICFAVVFGSRKATPNAEQRELQWLGDVSYSLYLSHPFVASAVTLVMLRINFGIATGAITGVIIIAAALLLAGLIYRTCELPLVSMSRAFLGYRHQKGA
jgi:exopolysaccharide production protein ExoZ